MRKPLRVSTVDKEQAEFIFSDKQSTNVMTTESVSLVPEINLHAGRYEGFPHAHLAQSTEKTSRMRGFDRVITRERDRNTHEIKDQGERADVNGA